MSRLECLIEYWRHFQTPIKKAARLFKASGLLWRLIQTFKQIQETNKSGEKKAGISISSTPGLDLNINSSRANNIKSEFEQTLFRYLDIKKSLINNLLKGDHIAAIGNTPFDFNHNNIWIVILLLLI